MKKKLIGLSGLLFSGAFVQGCTYNSIYDPWFDEDAPMYEEEVVRNKTEVKQVKTVAGAEKTPVKTESETEDSGFFAWLFADNDEEEVVVNVPHIPEDNVVHSENKSYQPQTEIDESAADITYDESVTRQKVTVIRPLAKPEPAHKDAPPAPKADTTTPVAVAQAPEVQTEPEEMAATSTQDEETFIEIPIAVLTNKEPEPAPEQPSSAPFPDEFNGQPTPLYAAPIVSSTQVPPYFNEEEALIASAPYQQNPAPTPVVQPQPLPVSAPTVDTPAPLDTLAAKLPASGPAVSFMTSNIPYLAGSANLDSKDRTSLEDTADLCSEYNCTVRIIAYADTTVTSDAPELSAQRADNIRKVLRKHGIKDHKIITEIIADEYAGDYAEVFIEY